MPSIAEFDGIRISMYFGDHNPPHFHAAGAGWVVRVNIASLSVMTLSGPVPPGIQRRLLDFAASPAN